MYTIAKLTDEPKVKGTGAVRGRDGVLLTEPDSIRARWVDHFSGLLNVPSEVDKSVLDHVEQLPVVHALDASISIAEVVKACQQQKNSEAPGGDGIPADVWKYGPEELQEQLLLVLNQA